MSPQIRSLLLGLNLLLLTVANGRALSGTGQGDYVVLLHGAARTPISILPMEIYLREHGYRVINLYFRCAGRSIQQVADVSIPEALENLDPHAKIHFVAHSMGAIILRQYLATHDLPNLGRVVMLGPPNHGSEFVDWAKSNRLLRILLGPRALELGTGADDLPTRLGPVQFDCGVIAGNRSFNPLSPFAFRGPNDGKVTVQSAAVPGMRDLLVVHIPHTWLVWQKSIFRQTVHFLESGAFDRQNTKAP